LAFEIIVIARFEILDQRISIQGKISKSTPGHAKEKKPDPQIGSSVIARDKMNNGKSSWKTLQFGRERLQSLQKTEKEARHIARHIELCPSGLR